jgi:DNA-binding response OmpR family regulator
MPVPAAPVIVYAYTQIPALKGVLRLAINGEVGQVQFLRSPEAFLDEVLLLKPSAVVLEMNETGFDIVRALRDPVRSPAPRVPMVGVTGEPTRATVNAVINAGVNELVTLPISPQIFKRRLNAAIHLPRDFIEAPEYFGPCRRRRADPGHKGPDRRGQDAENPASAPRLPAAGL